MIYKKKKVKILLNVNIYWFIYSAMTANLKMKPK